MARKPSRRSNSKSSRNSKKRVTNKFRKEAGEWLLRLIVIGIAGRLTWIFFGHAISPVIPVICLAIIVPTTAWLTWIAVRPFVPSLQLAAQLTGQWLKLFVTCKNVPSITDPARKPQR